MSSWWGYSRDRLGLRDWVEQANRPAPDPVNSLHACCHSLDAVVLCDCVLGWVVGGAGGGGFE